jgi:hypothetical protein
LIPRDISRSQPQGRITFDRLKAGLDPGAYIRSPAIFGQVITLREHAPLHRLARRQFDLIWEAPRCFGDRTGLIASLHVISR